jgi:hypothetical protein
MSDEPTIPLKGICRYLWFERLKCYQWTEDDVFDGCSYKQYLQLYRWYVNLSRITMTVIERVSKKIALEDLGKDLEDYGDWKTEIIYAEDLQNADTIHPEETGLPAVEEATKET